MRTSIVYASYTGTTHGIAEKIRDACGGELVEIRSQDLLSRFVTFTARRSPGMQVRESGTMPERLDVAGSDLVVIGTPVWGGKPVPAIRKAIAGLAGCEGKPAVIFATCGKSAGKTLDILARDVTKKGMIVAGTFPLNKEEIDDGARVTSLVAAVQQGGTGGIAKSQ